MRTLESFGISFALNTVDWRWATGLGKKRSGSMDHANTKNSRNFMPDKPPWWRHVIGVVAELGYSWWSGCPVNTTTIGRGDDGTDFPGGIQVKGSDHETPPDLLLGVSQWNRKHAAIYVLAWVRPDEVILMGWITRKEIEARHTIHDFGWGPAMVIPYTILYPMETLQLNHAHQTTAHES